MFIAITNGVQHVTPSIKQEPPSPTSSSSYLQTAMGVVDMSNNNPPTSRTKDFFASPALSLSLAGIFRDAGAAAASASASMDVEDGDEGSGGGGGGRREDTVEISSENSGPARSRSEDEFDPDGDNDEDGGGGDGDKSKKKKRKKYHRHTAEQIREMEAYVQITNSFPITPNSPIRVVYTLKRTLGP